MAPCTLQEANMNPFWAVFCLFMECVRHLHLSLYRLLWGPWRHSGSILNMTLGMDVATWAVSICILQNAKRLANRFTWYKYIQTDVIACPVRFGVLKILSRWHISWGEPRRRWGGKCGGSQWTTPLECCLSVRFLASAYHQQTMETSGAGSDRNQEFFLTTKFAADAPVCCCFDVIYVSFK